MYVEDVEDGKITYRHIFIITFLIIIIIIIIIFIPWKKIHMSFCVVFVIENFLNVPGKGVSRGLQSHSPW